MNIEDEIEWNSSMMNDGVILGTMEYMYKKGHTLQEANYVLFDDSDTSYAPILKAMSTVNQTHPDILLKELIIKNPELQQQQQQPQQQQQQPQQQAPNSQALASTGGATQFGGNAPRGMVMDNTQNYRATSGRDMGREGRANRREMKEQYKTQKLQDRMAAGKPITAGEKVADIASRGAARGKQAAGATRDFMRDKVAPGMADAGRGAMDMAGRGYDAAKEGGRKALGAAKEFFSGRMGREADGSAKEGFRGRMSRLAQGIKNTPKALAENRAAKRGRISNEGALRDNQNEIRNLKNNMHGGNAATGKLPGTDMQQANLAEMMEAQGGINEKLNDPNAKMSFRDRVKQIGDRQAQDNAVETPPAAEEEEEEETPAPTMTETSPAPTMTETSPERGMPDEASPIPTPAESVAGGAEPAAVEAAQTDTPMPEAEEDAYANYTGEGHEGFGGAKTTRGKTSRGIVDAMRAYEGNNMDELEQAVRASGPGGKRRLTAYQRRMMQQHAKRRGYGGDDSPAPTLTESGGGGDDEDPGAPDEPSTPDEPPAPTITETKKPKEPMKPMDIQFSEDPIDSAWNALMILKHR